MKICTNRNPEDPTGFGTSPGFCSTTQRICVILFNFCPNKAVFFRLPIFAFLLLAFAASPKWPGALGRVERVRMMADRTWKLQQKCRCFHRGVLAAGLMNLSLVRQIALAFFFGRYMQFPDYHRAGALLHRHVHTTFALAPTTSTFLLSFVVNALRIRAAS